MTVTDWKNVWGHQPNLDVAVDVGPDAALADIITRIAAAARTIAGTAPRKLGVVFGRPPGEVHRPTIGSATAGTDHRKDSHASMQ